MPPFIIVGLMAITFTAVLATGQGLYWAWLAKKDREQEELKRRLGAGGGATEDDVSLFRSIEKDAVANAMGEIGQRMQDAILAADAPYGVSQLVTRMFIASGIGMVIFGILIPPFGIVLGIPLGYVPYFLVNWQGNARKKKLVEQLPDSLALMSRSMSAGLGLSDAFRLVAEEMPMPIAGEFGRVTEEVRFGRDYREAFEKMLARNPGLFDLRIMVSSILLQRETGGNLIEILENIGETIQARFLFDAKVRAMTAEAKASALILAALPLVLFMACMVVNYDYISLLWTTTPGMLILTLGIFMYVFGGIVMNDMTKVEV